MPPQRPPILVHVPSPTVNALFDDRQDRAFPHDGRPVRADLASYLEGSARSHLGSAHFVIRVELESPDVDSASEKDAVSQMHRYFSAEARLAELQLRVNQREGWGFARRWTPLAMAALAVAGLLYVAGPGIYSGNVGSFATALLYLLFITIVWVLLWDPIEKLTFDAYLIRKRIAALHKLATTRVEFAHPGEHAGDSPKERKGPVASAEPRSS